LKQEPDFSGGNVSKKVQMKQKIKSINSTKKITHAIRLVSMSLYAKLEHQEPFVRYYVDTLSKLFVELSKNNVDWGRANLGGSGKNNVTPLFIIVSTTKGLCGGLNSSLFRYLSIDMLPQTIESAKFITVGQKAFNFVKDQLNGEIVCSYNDFNSNNYLVIASDIVTKFVDFSSVIFYFNKPKSFFSQRPTRFELLPISQDLILSQDGVQATKIGEKDMIWEQSGQQVLDFMQNRFIKSQVASTLLQALIAEYAARFLAMDSSTNNAEKFLEKLTLQYNKIRQGTITREVSELCATFMDRE
jgi:F-type H+-transporting ATPase subunit gamma